MEFRTSGRCCGSSDIMLGSWGSFHTSLCLALGRVKGAGMREAIVGGGFERIGERRGVSDGAGRREAG